jgi:hypothetical protein
LRIKNIASATETLEARISLTEAEIAGMKDGIKAKKAMVRAWRMALAAFSRDQPRKGRRRPGFKPVEHSKGIHPRRASEGPQ